MGFLAKKYEEKKKIKLFEREIKYWRKFFKFDSIWKINLIIFEAAKNYDLDKLAFADLERAEYWEADIGISKTFLDKPYLEVNALCGEIISHEMLHIFTADYHRCSLNIAGNNRTLQREITYRYEQMISKLSKILMNHY